MKKVVFGLIMSLTACAANDYSANDKSCLSNAEAIDQFESKEIAKLPNYTEPPLGGARVQEQHPNTYLFGQAKYIEGNGRSAGICQYSNHVGLVVNYMFLDYKTVNSLTECHDIDCEGKAYWRSEWRNSLPEQDQKGSESMYVCVKTTKGIDYPSVGCGFTVSDGL